MIIDLGVQVTVFDERAGAERSYRIVSPHQADPRSGLLSTESPVGRALVGRASGETVLVGTPHGPRALRILTMSDG